MAHVGMRTRSGPRKIRREHAQKTRLFSAFEHVAHLEKTETNAYGKCLPISGFTTIQCGGSGHVVMQ